MPDQGCGDAHRHRAPRERSQGARTSQSRASIAATPAAQRRIRRLGGEQRANMTFRSLLTCSALGACLVMAAPALADDGGGGAAAPATAAPAAEPSVAAAPAPDAAPVGNPQPPSRGQTPVVPAQDEPTTPGGEEQPDGAPPDGDELPEDGVNPVADLPEDGVGALPRSGLEVLALAMIGLGLLLAGAALWPTSSWPPPRDRLSRPALRR